MINCFSSAHSFFNESFEEAHDMAKYRIIKGETPNGGAYSEIYFLDDEGDPTDEKKAVQCVIRECAENGDLVNEIWGTVRN